MRLIGGELSNLVCYFRREKNEIYEEITTRNVDNLKEARNKYSARDKGDRLSKLKSSCIVTQLEQGRISLFLCVI